MKGLIVRILFGAAVLGLPSTALSYEGECRPNFAQYAKHVVHLTVGNGGASASGTAVWLRPDTLIALNSTFKQVLQDAAVSDVTIRVGHTPYEDNLSLYDKQQRDKDVPRASGRIVDRFEVFGDDLLLVRLDHAIAGAEPVSLRQGRPYRFGQPVFSVLYAEGGYWPQMRYAEGHIFKPDDEMYEPDPNKLDPRLLWAEMITRPEPRRGRNVAERGSPGSPVFDCDGVLIGLVSKGLTQNVYIGGIGPLPTAWGTPNITGVRIPLMLSALLERIK